jgi:hypothetical protein
MDKIVLEGYTQVSEKAKISGVALIPRISRNNNLYTKAELERFNGVTVPLNWEHDGTKVIGTATFHYNAELETVYYEGEVTNEAAASVVKNKTMFTSIEATPIEMKQVCNGGGDCFSMPYGLRPEGLALTETPGVPETTVHVIESYIKTINECEHHFAQVKGKDYVADFKNKQTSEMENTTTDGCGCSDSTEETKDMKTEVLAVLGDLGLLESLDLEYCSDCGKLEKKTKNQ